MADKPSVRVLHRAVDSDDDEQHSSQPGSPQQSLQELKASNDSLKQRLEQAKASAAAEKKKLGDEVRLERAGRERAEELLVRQAKELEACAAAKARLEEAFSRSMSELRYTRAEHEQSKQTIQQLLRELMLLRDAISRSSQGAAGGRSSLPAGALDTSSGGSGSPKAGSKQMSKGQLLNELHAMRSRMAEEQSRRREAEVEKERAEESQDMISRQTAKLLDDRAALLSDLSSKDDVVRDMQAALDSAHHQLNLLDHDNSILREQLRILKGGSAAPGLHDLTVAMEGGYSHTVQQDLDELEAYGHGEYNGELHGGLGAVCSPRGSRRLSEGLAGLGVGLVAAAEGGSQSGQAAAVAVAVAEAAAAAAPCDQ